MPRGMSRSSTRNEELPASTPPARFRSPTFKGAHFGPRKPELKAAALIARTGEMLTNPGSSADSSSNSLATSEPSVG